MKKKFHTKNLIGKKSAVLVAVSLILVIVTAVSVTASWIEEVSRVEFSTNNDSQQTPLHVGQKKLNSDVNMVGNTEAHVKLDEYFYKAGDMHLSPCYSDGEKFYFPIPGGGFREGTKDDANVNYMSATFRINSINADTAYWFEKTSGLDYISFKKGDTDNNNVALKPYLRCSVTIDGATNVYALNNTGQFKKLASSTDTDPTVVTGRRIDQYTYYQEAFNDSSPEGYYKHEDTTASLDNVSTKPNQGEGENLNGNTLYTVKKYDSTTNAGTKVVTVKIWLEYDNQVNSDVDVASVNMNFVSSWAKTRRVYVKDSTVNQVGYTQAKWLSHNGTADNQAVLFWAIKDRESTANFKLQRVSPTSDYYYVDIPAVYNNVPAVLSRRGKNNPNQSWENSTWANTSEWDKWNTTFPDTFHSEVYKVYSTNFGTWEDSENIHAVYFVDSGNFSGYNPPITPKNYMWDSNSVHGAGVNQKVVKNADWPGVDMTQLNYNSGKGWDFYTDKGNCTLHATEAGYYTFRFSKDSNNVYYLLVTYSSTAVSINATQDSSFKLHRSGRESTADFTDWSSTIDNPMKILADDSYIVSVQLSAGYYQFKIKYGSNTYYGNDGTIEKTNYSSGNNFPIYTFHYASDYDYAVFSDGVSGIDRQEYQTQDLMIFNKSDPDDANYAGKTFDMATLTWFDATPENTANLPYYSGGNTYLYGNFVTGSTRWVGYRFAYGGQYGSTADNAFNTTSTSHLLSKVYIKSAGDFEFVIYYNNKTYKGRTDNVNLYKDNSLKLYAEEDNSNNNQNCFAKNLKAETVYRFYVNPIANNGIEVFLYEGEN